MQTAEVLDVLNEVERQLPVDHWLVDDIHIWPLARFLFAVSNSDAQRGSAPASGSGKVMAKRAGQMFRLLGRLPAFGWSCLQDHKMNDRRRAADVVLLSDGVSFLRLQSGWYERFCDPFRSRFEERGLSCLLLTPLHHYLTPRHSPSLFIQPHLDAVRVRNALSRSRFRIDERDLEGFSAFAELLCARQPSAVVPTLERVSAGIGQIRGFSEFYKRVLEKANPAIALQVCYYGGEGMAFNLACRELGIPSVDIQHGVQGDLHYAYGRWMNVPETGYELLPSLFWCWSDYEARAVERWNARVSRWHRPVVGGNLLLQMWQSGRHEAAAYYDQKMQALKAPHGDALHVLYTLGGLDEAEPARVVRLVQAAERRGVRVCFWVRPHPINPSQGKELASLLRGARRGNVELEQATIVPLYALLRQMDLHVTEYSSTVMEAAAFGVPSVVTHPLGMALFPEQVAAGWILQASSPEDIVEALQIQLGKRASLRQTMVAAPERDGLRALLNLVSERRGKSG